MYRIEVKNQVHVQMCRCADVQMLQTVGMRCIELFVTAVILITIFLFSHCRCIILLLVLLVRTTILLLPK